MSSTLTLRHLPPKEDEPTTFHFQVIDPAGKQVGDVDLPAPESQMVEDLPQSNLLRELAWYLEEFLDYPFEPVTDRARRVLDAMSEWGKAIHEAILCNRDCVRAYDNAVRDGFENLNLRIISNEPAVLTSPWEAMCDPQGKVLGHASQVERRVEKNVAPPMPLPDTLPTDAVHILLVTARPFESDVAFRCIGRPLMELIEQQNLPARVHMLRPPTFAALREHLRENKGKYHIVHFDGHGDYSREVVQGAGGADFNNTSNQNPYTFKATSRICFETDVDDQQLSAAEYHQRISVTPEQFASVMREAQVPTVIFNACRSGKLDKDAADPFASVSAALLQAGVRNVVAMAYNLYVSAAQEFLPAFYGELFKSGSVSSAVRIGRQQLNDNPGRVCARGTFPLQDWLVPVLYQQDPFSFDFA